MYAARQSRFLPRAVSIGFAIKSVRYDRIAAAPGERGRRDFSDSPDDEPPGGDASDDDDACDEAAPQSLRSQTGATLP